MSALDVDARVGRIIVYYELVAGVIIMSTHRFVVVASLPVLFATAAKYPRLESVSLARAGAEPDACALLTESDVSTALEIKSLAGAHPIEPSKKMCAWSDVGNA